MPDWKLKLFIDVITARMKRENKTAEEIIFDYIKLTVDEKQEILENIK